MSTRSAPFSSRTGRRAAAVLSLLLLPGIDEAAAAPPTDGSGARTIIDLQPSRQEERATLANGMSARLIALNPAANSWFLLETGRGSTNAATAYHLENPDPAGQQVHLVQQAPAALVVSRKGGSERCAPWEGNPSPLDSARVGGLPYAPLCGGRLYLRNRVAGSRTNLERMTDFLRDHVWEGDEIVGLVRDTFFKDSFVESGKEVAATGGAPRDAGPGSASLDPAYTGQAVVPAGLEIGLSNAPSGRLSLGAWYAVADMPGIYVAVVQPKALPQPLLRSAGANGLDGVESAALDYLVAFDLSRFDLGFALGTDHPRVGWSPRVPATARDDRLAGPDGFGTAAPLVTVGMVSPALAGRTVAAFTAGFKREHGAFKYGDLSIRNHGSHYGFIEQGVVFSTLQPGLATLLVLDDGTVRMKTWMPDDDQLLSRIRFARQNGVALLEPLPDGGGTPGALVTKWGAGNWSGSASEQLRTLRAGACLKDASGRQFLIYGYFSTATPSAMARTFQAFGCSYAMLLDMNALEHTYLAVYVRRNGKVRIEHLIAGMSQVDKTAADGKLIPRFVGFPDNRDFFYLVQRKAAQ